MATTPNVATPADLAWSPRALLRRLRSADEIAHLITLIAAAMFLLITALLVYQLNSRATYSLFMESALT
jgi:hypothetical protein